MSGLPFVSGQGGHYPLATFPSGQPCAGQSCSSFAWVVAISLPQPGTGVQNVLPKLRMRLDWVLRLGYLNPHG